MSRRLFIVEDSFSVDGHGLVLIPGILFEGEERFRIGDRMTLRQPDGLTREVRIGGSALLYPNPRCDVVILLRGMTKGDAPVGTQVWSTEDSAGGKRC